MPTERQAVEAGTSHVGAEGGGMSEEPILWCFCVLVLPTRCDIALCVRIQCDMCESVVDE